MRSILFRNYLIFLAILPVGLEIIQLHNVALGDFYVEGLEMARFFTILCLVLAASFWLKHQINLFGNRLASTFIALLILVILTQWFSLPHRQDEFGFFTWLSLISAAMILTKSPTVSEATDAIAFLVWVLTIFVVFGLVTYVTFPDFAGSMHVIRGPVEWLVPEIYRFRGLMNTVGAMGFVAGIVTLYGLFGSSRLNFLFVMLGIPALLLSDTRGAILSLSAASGVLAIVHVIKRQWWLAAKPTAVSVTFCIYILLYKEGNSFINGASERIQFWQGYTEEGASERIQFWQGYTEESGVAMPDGPLDDLFLPEESVVIDTGRAHNFIIQAVSDAGTAGFILVILLALIIVAAVFLLMRDGVFMPATLLIYIPVFSLTDYGIDLARWSIGTTIVVLALLAVQSPSSPSLTNSHAVRAQPRK